MKKIEIKRLGKKCFRVLILLFSILYSLFSVSFAAGFEPGAVRPKIITPASSPGMNDILIVPYDNPNDSNVGGKILTINGSYIADMLNNDDRITWDGKDDGGSIVPSGIYIYQIEAEGQIFNGTVVVAK